jgi:predicted DNA-binding transcriptional regulator AlpA
MKLLEGKPTVRQSAEQGHNPDTGQQNTLPVITVPGGSVLREKDAALAMGLSRTTRWRMRKRGDGPRPIRLGPNSIGYLRSEVEQWLRERERA